MMLETHLKLCVTDRFFQKHFAPKIEKMCPKWAKNKLFFEFIEKLKVYIICYVTAQSLYLEKI